jgi:orotate phosphoribosyltransferase
MSFPLEHDRARLLELLRTLSFERRKVILASGRESNFYIDCRRTTLTAEGHWLIGRLLLDRILRVDPPVAGVGGMTLGADPIASAVSFASWAAARPLQAFLVRKEAKGHGTGQYVEGLALLPPGSRVAVVEDVVTTGGSGLLACERAEAAGLQVAGIFALVDREEGGREAFEARGYRLETLFTRRDFLGDET